MNVNLQLRRRVSQRSECRDHGNFARLYVKPGTRVNVAEWEFYEVAGEVWRNVFETVDDSLASLAINLLTHQSII